MGRVASGLRRIGIARDQRVAVYLPKQFETVTSMFGTTAAGGVFVPVNPILKPEQVGHILRDCTTSVLITSADRARLLKDTLEECPDLQQLVITDSDATEPFTDGDLPVCSWQQMLGSMQFPDLRRIDADMAAILYTSGSTGRPKGVVLSHRNKIGRASCRERV